MESLPHPQALGSFYTTYLLWAVAPEGQAENLAELPHSKSFGIDVTTSFQSFGLIVTAEPHSAVRLPSPMVVAETAARQDTVGVLRAGQMEYGTAVGDLYAAVGPDDVPRRDFATPLLLLGARHAMDLAKHAGAETQARTELREAQAKLSMLEQIRPRRGKLPKEAESLARDVMRLAEHARGVSADRIEQARLDAERRAAGASIAMAMSDADRERARAAQARSDAAEAKAAEDQARMQEEQARLQAQKAQQEAELARSDADRARLEAEQAQTDKAQLQQQLYESLSAILETRREARGFIVSLSDVLFDFDRATLTPGAREKLSKLAGVLMAYPGHFRLEFEGHTDSVGTHNYNMRLSQDRADSVRLYVMQAGIPTGRLAGAVGFGKTRPVASNDNAAGRQMNRRVEIIVADLN
jgi:outer membrane protein OmpA-like peptidoglycan-associated protein